VNYNTNIFRFANHTDIGRIRKQNEDYMGYFENQNGTFFLVCDGMGGHVGGAVASQTAVQSIRAYFERQYYEVPSEAIYQAILYANQQIFQKSQFNLDLKGMGTTCVLLMFRSGKLYYGHVGDSRLYMHSTGFFRRLTRDHSFVQALIDQGLLAEEDAENHPRRNELLRALGTQNFVDVEVSIEPIIPKRGDTFLLCSDGLNSLVSDAGINEILNQRLDIQQKALRLVETANALGGYDNITVQLIEFFEDSQPLNTNTPLTGDSYVSPQNEIIAKKALKGDLKSQYIEPISEERASKKKIIKEESNWLSWMNIDTTNEDVDFRPILFRVFSVLIFLIFVYILYQRTIGPLNILGSSGSLRQDSLRAIQIEDDFWRYFWNRNPGMQKVKNTLDKTKETFQKIKSYVNSFKNMQVRNSLKEESVGNLAKRYRTKIDWILKANNVKNETELKKLDSLIVPLEEPPLHPEAKDSLR
jgi:serine/threonine protein phosphatase PrpC